MVRIFQAYNQFLSLLLTFVYLIASYFLGSSLGELLDLPKFIFYIPFMFFITFSGNLAIFFELITGSVIIIIYSIYIYICKVNEFKTLYGVLSTLIYTIGKEFNSFFTIFLNSITFEYLQPAVLFSFAFLILRYIFILIRPPKYKDV